MYARHGVLYSPKGVFFKRFSPVRPHLNCLHQDDPELLDFLRQELIWPPFIEQRQLPNKWWEQIFNLNSDSVTASARAARTISSTKSSSNQNLETDFSSRLVRMILWRTRTPFSLSLREDGLGYWWSHFYGKRGETNRTEVKSSHRNAIKRNAWCAPVCLGLHPKPHFAPFTTKAIEGGMAGLVAGEGEETSEYQCFPLARYLASPNTKFPLPSWLEKYWYVSQPQILKLHIAKAKFPPIFPSILLAVGNRTVNYLSLDIEGAELQVLKYTISCPVIVISKSIFFQQNMFLTYFDVFSLFRY